MNAMKPRGRFGLDLDGVVFAFDIGACLALKMHGVDIDVRESTSWNDIKERVSDDAWKWLWNEGVREAFALAPVYPGVAAEVRQIQDVMDVIVITHRPRSVVDITLKRLGELGFRPNEVHHIQHGDKALITRCDAYVDDKPENVLGLALAHDVPVFMPRKPWNSDYHEPHALNQANETDIRVYDDFREVTQWVRAR